MSDSIIRPLAFEHLDETLRLSSVAGWNQRIDDWRMLLWLAPSASFAALQCPETRSMALAKVISDVGEGYFAVSPRIESLGIWRLYFKTPPGRSQQTTSSLRV